jgi:hypothetical protein
VGILGNELSDERAAEARSKNHLDSTVWISQALEKARAFMAKAKIWRGSLRTAFPVQAAFHQLQSGHVHLNNAF